MSKAMFLAFARDVSVSMAMEIAVENGVSRAQAQLWAAGVR